MSRSSATAVAAAVWLGTLRPLPWWTAGVGAVVLLTGGILGARTGGGRDTGAAAEGRADRARLVVALAALFLCGAGLGGGRAAMRDAGPLSSVSRAGALAEIVVVTEPRTGGYGAWSVVRVHRFGAERVRQRAFLRTAAPPAIGARLRLRAVVSPLPSGAFGDHVRSLGAGVALKPLTLPEPMTRPGALLGSTSRLRDTLRGVARRALPPDRASLLTGLVTGDGRDRPEAVDDLLTAAGLRHLVVVSGRHTALFLAGVLGLAAALRISFRATRLSALTALAWFVLLVRWQPSVLRAATVAAVILVADLLGRDRDHVHLLAMAVTGLLLVDPLLGRQLGFVLSVTATAGVLVLAPLIHARLRGPPWWRIGVSAAVGAQAAVAPVLVAMDEAVPLGGVAANLVAAPAAALAQVVGTVAALVAVPVPGLAAVIAQLSSWPLGVILWAAEVAGRVPDAQAVFGRPGVVPAVVAAVLAVIGWRRLSGPRRWVTVLGGLAVVVVAIAPRGAVPVDVLTVTMFDVGQGDALLVEAPGDGPDPARMLVDGGPEDSRVVGMLARRGIRALDVVVATHAHADHTGGLPAVLRRVQVGAVVTAARSEPPRRSAGRRSHGSSGMAAVLAAARGRGVAHVPLAAGAQFRLGAARVRVLSPPEMTRGWNENDRSLVLRIDGAHGSVLLTGDVEEDSQRRLLREPGLLRVDVVKVPHHGGATNAGGFLDAAGATVALTPVGEDNDYGHPAPSVLADLGGARTWRTDVHGTVRVELLPRGPSVSTS